MDSGMLPDRSAPSISLASLADHVCAPMEKALRDVGDAIRSRSYDEAAVRLADYRTRMARYLAWEESAVLPAYARLFSATGQEVTAAHERGHRSLLELADDLRIQLRTGAWQATEAELSCLLLSIVRKCDEHRERELGGLCAVLDSRLPAAEVKRIAAALARASD